MTSRERIKVLQVVPAMSKESGVMRYVWNMMREIDQNRIAFDYLYHIPSSITFEKECMASGSRIYCAPDASKEPLRYVRYVNELLKSEGIAYSIVHCHVPNTAFCVLRAASYAGVKNRLIHSHLAASSEHLSHRIRNYPLIRYGKRFATERLACSQEAGDYLFGDQSYRIFRNGIDVEAFRFDEAAASELKRKLPIGPDAFPVVGCVGRLAKQKNYPFMFDVFRELLKTEHRAELLIVGSGPEEEALSGLIAEFGLEGKVHLLGLREDVGKLYSVFDVLAMPSLCEGLPVAAVEAQASGLRCVFSKDVPSEVDITGVATFLGRKERLSDWSDAIANAALEGRFQDPAMRIDDAGYSQRAAALLLADFYTNQSIRK
ncbi:MAG: glycosyltransferase [Eggerthellaceae bacterium]|nr:glycosyltransferase [Eggerthellaceae bacterium]